jgi:hypothetical protein
MADSEQRDPGERRTPGERMASVSDAGARKLAQPPSARYLDRPGPGHDAAPTGARLRGPLAKALVVAAAGAVALVALGAIFASTIGLLFTSGATGAAIGLVLARAAVPPDDPRAVPRRTVEWLSIGLAIAAIVVAGIATWIIARQEGGTLGPLDYLVTTFGPFVPGEAVLAALGAWWGASSGPVQG